MSTRSKPFEWSELTTRWDEEHWFPFVEDPNCNITGPGHMDKAAFAALVDQFERVASGEATTDPWDPDVIVHRWVVPTDDDEGLFITKGVTAETPGAVPVTTLWGQR